MKGWKSIVIELFCNQHLVKRMTHAAEGERERERERECEREREREREGERERERTMQGEERDKKRTSI